MSKELKTIFMGTPAFAVPSLQTLINDDRFKILAVITQMDKKVGRKQILTPGPIKQIAWENKIKILQPNKLDITILEPFNCDLIVVVAFGQILKKDILEKPLHGCVNIHASLLPKYRGASCLSAPILNGDKTSGLSIMKMDEGLDTGPIIKQAEIELSANENLTTLHDKLADLSAKILPDTLIEYVDKKIILQKQDNGQASYVKQMTKNDGLINWEETAEKIERKIRAYHPWPGTQGDVWQNDKKWTIKIIEVQNIIADNKHKPGELFIHDKKLAVKCLEKALVISKLQIPGKKPLSGQEFLRGQRIV